MFDCSVAQWAKDETTRRRHLNLKRGEE